MSEKVLALSTRARNTPPSPIRKLAHLAVRARSEGKKVYHLNIGQPDIKTPTEFFEGVARFKDDVLAYEQSQGNDELRKAWVDYTNRTLELSLSPEQLLITTGASEALIFLFMICCDPGDEIIIFDPTYANYIGFAAIAGVNLVPVPSSLDENFPLPPQAQIESRITPRTRAILLCSPNNPTGTVYTRAEIQSLLNICNERNLYFLVDETYREFVYDDIEPLSVLHLTQQNDRVIVVDSLSKRFSLCGARLGCLISSNKEVLAAALNLAQARLASPTIDQLAAAHMLRTISDTFVSDVRQVYQSRRDVLFAGLHSIPGVVVRKPRGAFYIVAKLPVTDAGEFASYLLSEFSHNQATTFVAPAAGFYMESKRGADKIRLAYVLNEDDLRRAVEILTLGLEAYRCK
jgi:aspartate aminotransferase